MSLAPSSAARQDGFRHGVREKFSRFRRRSRSSDPPRDTDTSATPRVRPLSASGPSTLTAQHATPFTSPSSLRQTHDVPNQTTTAEDDTAKHQIEGSSLNCSILGIDIEVADISSDLWSAAYREAVNSLGKDINIVILKGDNVADLFRDLERIEKDAAEESVLLRGVKYLQSLQVPLERFKLALDLASPLTSIEPTTSTVFGVVKTVTAIAISFSTADLDFAKKIGEMLEQLSYIDDCDTLGQKTEKKDIHQALVLVYQKLLEFYASALEILSTRKGVKRLMAIVLEDGRLPKIVSDFLRHADHLRKLVQKATLEIVEDIKSMLYDHEIARWLGSEKMSRQSQHHAYLREIRADRACEFLLADPKFIKWYQATDSQQLAILGEMGSGKTVAMAFLTDELRRRSEHQWPQPKICYHYCRDDGTGQPVYVYSALILSLLEQLPGLKRAFLEWYKQTVASGTEPATSFRKLEEWLSNTLGTLDRPLIISIDGLDECDRQSRNCLVESLRALSRRTPRVKILLSSRPEEEILELLNGMDQVTMASDATRDWHIVGKTVKNRLSYLSKEVKALVIETLALRAQGSAIWTKMTVELVEVRGIRALGPMQAFLEKMPQPKQLSELYVSLFSRYTSNDAENQRLAATALEVLAVTRRPLSILELAWAVALGAAEDAVPTVEALVALADHQRVMSLILPFIVHVDFSDLKKRQVKLVHQSVKEFIVRQRAPNKAEPQRWATSTSMATTDPGLVQQRIESLEASILDICIRYLSLRDVGDMALFSSEYLALVELPQESDLFQDNDEPNNYDHYCSWEEWERTMIHYDPTVRGFGELFVYASCNWVEHFGATSAKALLPSLDDIEHLCRAGSMRLRNWTTQNCRPGCRFKARFDFDSDLYDPLVVTSLYGSEIMLQHMLDAADLAGDSYLPNPAMAAAEQILHRGDVSRLKLLWGSKIGHQIQNLAFFRLALEQWSNNPADKYYRHGWAAVFDLVGEALDTVTKERWGNELLALAARNGCMPVIRGLMEGAQDHAGLRAELLDGSPSDSRAIAEAVLGNHLEILEYLLGQRGIEAHVRHRNSYGENVLHLASRLCNPAVFQLLLPRVEDCAYQTDHQNDTALIRIVVSSAASQDRYESARILLSELGAGQDDRFHDELQEALRVATRLGDLDMCGLLIRFGMNLLPDDDGDDGGVALRDRIRENEKNFGISRKTTAER